MQQSLTESTSHTELGQPELGQSRVRRTARTSPHAHEARAACLRDHAGAARRRLHLAVLLCFVSDTRPQPGRDHRSVPGILRLPLVYSVILVGLFFAQHMYQRRRSTSHLDETYRIFLNNIFATLLTVAVLTLAFPDFEYHRPFIVFASAINIGIMTVVRATHAQVQWRVQARGVGDDRVLLIGTGEVGEMLLQKILQNRQLGYQVIGVVDVTRANGGLARLRRAAARQRRRLAVDHRRLQYRRGDHRPAGEQPPGTGRHHQPLRAREGRHPRLSRTSSRSWPARSASAISAACRCSRFAMWRCKGGRSRSSAAWTSS